jgi:hypothetical protein
MEDIWHRVVGNLFGRLDGPLHFRIILQPVMAVFFAVIDGVKDAKMDKPVYFWAIIFNPEQRGELLKEGWKHVGKIFILAVILDLAYQLIVFHWVYPGELLIVAFFLAIVPYLLLRGPVNRIIQMFRK